MNNAIKRCSRQRAKIRVWAPRESPHSDLTVVVQEVNTGLWAGGAQLLALPLSIGRALWAQHFTLCTSVSASPRGGMFIPAVPLSEAPGALMTHGGLSVRAHERLFSLNPWVLNSFICETQ